MGLFDSFMGFDFGSPSQGGGSFPVQDFRNDSFASFMNPLQNFMPATRSYMDEMQNIPTYEQNKPGIGRTIGAALAGIASGIGGGNPAAVASSIVNQPYMRAMGDFQNRIQGLGQAAKSEQGMAGLARQFSNDAFQRSQFGQELGLKREGMDLERILGNRKIDIEDKRLEAQIAQQSLDRALQEKKITIDQHQAESQRIAAQANATQSNAMADYYKMGGPTMGRPGTQPSAAMTQERVQATFLSDPVINKYFDEKGNLDIESLRDDPNAMMRLQQLYQQLGLTARPDIALPQGR